MIKFENVSMRYGPGLEALSKVSFEINRGELVFLTGHSGAGKSTVLRLVLALETCSGGSLLVAGKRIKGLSKSELALHRRQIGAVFQDHQLLFDRSVGDNVALPLQIAEFPHREIKRRVRAALDKVGLLHKETYSPAHLSGGGIKAEILELEQGRLAALTRLNGAVQPQPQQQITGASTRQPEVVRTAAE